MARKFAWFEWLELIWPETESRGRTRRGPQLVIEHLEPRQMLAADGLLFALNFHPESAPGAPAEIRDSCGGELVESHLGASRLAVEGPEIVYLEDLVRAVGDAVDPDGDTDWWESTAYDA